MENSLLVTSSPHIRDKSSVWRIMLDVVIALLPALAAGTYFFGARSLLVAAVTVASCVAAEFISGKVLKRDTSIGDLSAVVTGVLLALNLPASIPLWMAAVGGVMAIVIVKQLFGGIGQNFMNPALAARVMMLISWPEQMTNWIIPRGADAVTSATTAATSQATGAVDAVSSATPLAILKVGLEGKPDYLDLFLGKVGGCIGETSAIALLIGVIYLLIRKVISLETPLSFIGTVALFTWIFGGERPFTGDFIYHVLAGGLILGAFFMATDYSTSPAASKGKIIMGIGAGILTSVIRLYTNYPEGVSFAILIMNALVPLIDKFTVPKSFGGERANG